MEKRSYEERIGESLVRVGAMSQEQTEEVLKRQKAGDSRLFGEIALDLGFIQVRELIDFLRTPEKELIELKQEIAR
ncbi:MAG: hypothetical protein AB1798_12520 [Spirochaetota bacterium]